MNKRKLAKLRARGWQAGNAAQFLKLSPGEAEFVELKATLARQLRKKRESCHLTQMQTAQLIQSSQSRLAKMEKGDPAVTLDLMVRSLFALGVSKRELAKVICQE